MAQMLDLGRVLGERGPQGEKGDTGERGFQGPQGERGEKGDAFTYADFTQEQLEALRGPQGETGAKGEKGDAFVYEDFTQEQLEALRGPKGDTGAQGERGEKGDVGETGERGSDGVMTRQMYTLSFPASGWTKQTDGSITQTAAASGMLESDVAHVDIDAGALGSANYSTAIEAWSKIVQARTLDGGLMLTCFEDAPQADLSVIAEVIR